MAFWVLAFGDAMALLQATGGDTPCVLYIGVYGHAGDASFTLVQPVKVKATKNAGAKAEAKAEEAEMRANLRSASTLLDLIVFADNASAAGHSLTTTNATLEIMGIDPKAKYHEYKKELNKALAL